MTIYKKVVPLNLKDNEISTPIIHLTSEHGAVILGKVVLPNSSPAFKATVVLCYIETATQAKIPITFTFTDIKGEFMFGIQDLSKTYVLTVQYAN